MHFDKVAIVIILTLVLVVLYNIGLLFTYQGDDIQRVSKRAKEPWKDEDDALEELSRRVKELQGNQSAPDTNQPDLSRVEVDLAAIEKVPKQEKEPRKNEEDEKVELSRLVKELQALRAASGSNQPDSNRAETDQTAEHRGKSE